ncbi:hypothetical protein [Sphingobacterium corticibacter]|nr:hypothetical protein [Sphingobacterium corticibacter]
MTGIGACDLCHWSGGTIGIPPVPINPPTSPAPPIIIPIPPSPGGPPSGVPPTMLNPNNDCDHARNMQFDKNLIAQLLMLRAHADDPNKRTEKGFTYNINYTTGLYSSMSSAFEGLPNAPFIDFNISSPIDGLAHTHYSGLFPIFSPADITAMAAIYNTGYMSKPTAFSSILLTNAGTTYMLKIENVDMFKNWASSIKGNYNILNDIASLYPLGAQYSISTNEKSINQLLQQNKTGLRLYRGNKDANDWYRLGLDKNNNVSIDPCNK